jgi:3-phenylpropionate/trans-cinnamate dioxygenase ferredoxin subunit
MDFVKVGAVTDFPANSSISVTVNGVKICLANANGAFYAVDDQCTHARFPLSGGEVDDGQITCGLHGARFDLKTGAATLPAVQPVRIHDVNVENGSVFVRLRA